MPIAPLRSKDFGFIAICADIKSFFCHPYFKKLIPPSCVTAPASSGHIIVLHISCVEFHIDIPQFLLSIDVILIHFSKPCHTSIAARIYVSE